VLPKFLLRLDVALALLVDAEIRWLLATQAAIQAAAA
jgi:hypothetical protein